MASKQERREQKQRAKQKVRRAEAQASRKARSSRARAGASQAATWPVADAWISQDWYEWERSIHGVLARAHADGTHAAVVFEVDLAEDGLRAAEVQVGLQLGHVQGLLSDRSEDDRAMVTVDPAALARLFHDGLAHRRGRGVADPKHLDDALAMFGDVDPEDSPFDFHFGRQGEDDPTEELPAPTGRFARIKRWFGR